LMLSSTDFYCPALERFVTVALEFIDLSVVILFGERESERSER
jgi:hypothetical protein